MVRLPADRNWTVILNNVILPRTGSAICLLVTLGLGACAPARPPSVVPSAPGPTLPLALTWLGEFTRPSASVYPLLSDSARFGSVSGLALDTTSGQWIGAIDDRDSTRVAWLTIEFGGGRLQVTPTRLMALTPGPGVADRVARESDLEAIVALPDGTFLMGEEGHVLDGEVWQPAILHVTRDGVVLGVTAYPGNFSITDDPGRGLRDNQGFESLTRMPSGRVIAGLEQPLKQDGEPTSFTRPAAGRLIAFERRGSEWQPGIEWRYMISPTPRLDGFPQICSDGENGLVDLLALTETTLVAMERACLLDAAGEHSANAVQLFTVELIGNEARKRPLLDLAKLAPKLSPAIARLENFEALAFGPTLPNGTRTLLVVSDDNFRATQKTSFLLFGIR
ncbi:MAG: esterase-like activity of phytase family protein [Acidobacteriota bacterium]|nr:esterase-like activity of phytase family protein [Acidobacteriota bacterium]